MPLTLVLPATRFLDDSDTFTCINVAWRTANVRGRSRARSHGCAASHGRAYAVGYVGKLQFSGLLTWFVWAGVRIAYLVWFRNRILPLAQWAWLHLTFQHGARLIPEDAETHQIATALSGSQ